MTVDQPPLERRSVGTLDGDSALSYTDDTTDRAVAERVMDALANELALEGAAITVLVDEGRVRLSGTARDEDQAFLASVLAADRGACRLGEVAFVDSSSRIGRTVIGGIVLKCSGSRAANHRGAGVPEATMAPWNGSTRRPAPPSPSSTPIRKQDASCSAVPRPASA